MSEDIVERMNICAVAFPSSVDELAMAGLTPRTSCKVAPPLIAESPVSLESREFMSVGLGEGRTVVVGNVVALHIADEFFDERTRRVKTQDLRLVGRMHGDGWYVRTTDLFHLKRLKLDEIEAGNPFE
jgi:flavin reductase (DIM6/NTAB) family NADH-FMN oxidoreductase RutF